jgi:hypothetical protein
MEEFENLSVQIKPETLKETTLGRAAKPPYGQPSGTPPNGAVIPCPRTRLHFPIP